MSQVDPARTTQETTSTNKEFPPHQILVTKASSSPPRSRSQSAGSAHKEALLFFQRHQLFDEPQLFKTESEEALGESNLIRKRSQRGRSHSQPGQVHLSTATGTGGSDSLLKQEKGKCSWLEQIQFTAQFQHFRTNDYSSVVNSASSLDKVGSEKDKVRP